MVDAFTGTTALSNQVQPAIDRYIRAQLRHLPILRRVADTRPVQVDKPGSSVTLYVHQDLAPATTPLSETSDPDAVALSNPISVSITPQEYGLATISTIKVRATSFSDVDPQQVDQVSRNMLISLDQLVANVANAGTNVLYGGTRTARNTVTSQDVASSTLVRRAVTKLRGNAAVPRIGELYWCGIHPDVSHDLREETGSTGWFEGHKGAAPDVFWPNVTGVWAGCFFQESARMTVANDGGEGTDVGTGADPVYRTLIAGKEALAEAVVKEPGVQIGVVPDKFNRFFPMGWYGYLGWGRFREEALYRLETGSSVAPNT